MAKSWMLDRRDVLETIRQSDGLQEAYISLAKLPAADVRENVIRTQADKLRAMSDEELATHFALKQPCPNDRFCGDYDCKSFEDCHDCWLDWLKAEVDDG